MSDFSHLLLVLNSSVNIIIYGWKDKKFRELLLKLFNLECFVKTNSVSVVKMAREKDLTMTQLTILENQKTLTRSEADLDAHEDENMISYSVLWIRWKWSKYNKRPTFTNQSSQNQCWIEWNQNQRCLLKFTLLPLQHFPRYT